MIEFQKGEKGDKIIYDEYCLFMKKQLFNEGLINEEKVEYEK